MGKAIIALAGKGGVGKTSICATIVRQLVKQYPDKRILAIDADPAVGLATALNVKVEKTIDDIRKQIVEAGEKNDDKRQVKELLGEARYLLFDAMIEEEGFTFIAVGRPEAKGCYCGINSYLKEVISLLSQEFDYVVIDGEAGIEQINRRVMEQVTHLILVSDPSKKGTTVIQTIKRVADDLVMYQEVGAIINRFNDESLKGLINTGGINVLSYISDDVNLQMCDIKGESVLDLTDNSNIVKGVEEALIKLNII
ncbi:MAG: AAA family ATPase [Erysipelotrichaceae bacterium]